MEDSSQTFQEWRRDCFLISTDPARLDLGVIHAFLTQSYWALGIPIEIVAKSIAHSLCFGMYDTDPPLRQVGFARVVTDRATFAYIADVFVLEDYRGRGLATWLIETITNHPDLNGLRHWLLLTRDAHALYEKVGFARTTVPDRVMQKRLTHPYPVENETK